MSALSSPLNFSKWIEEHRHRLKPPVGNQQVWADREFMVTVVGGPNLRTDYHINEGEEFFYQLEGDMTLRLRQGGEIVDLPIRQGEIYLLPARVPHSPQRPEGTVGLVIERRRLPHEQDGFVWFCEKCDAKVHEEWVHLKDIVKDLPPAFSRYFDSPENSTCPKCHHRHTRPQV